MSSTLKSVEGDWLDKPMISEFRAWIKHSIAWRMKAMNYPEASSALNDGITECLFKHTNRDYLTCSDKLTSALEETLVYFGININDAIRLSWKWSD